MTKTVLWGDSLPNIPCRLLYESEHSDETSNWPKAAWYMNSFLLRGSGDTCPCSADVESDTQLAALKCEERGKGEKEGWEERGSRWGQHNSSVRTGHCKVPNLQSANCWQSIYWCATLSDDWSPPFQETPEWRGAGLSVVEETCEVSHKILFRPVSNDLLQSERLVVCQICQMASKYWWLGQEVHRLASCQPWVYCQAWDIFW